MKKSTLEEFLCFCEYDINRYFDFKYNINIRYSKNNINSEILISLNNIQGIIRIYSEIYIEDLPHDAKVKYIFNLCLDRINDLIFEYKNSFSGFMEEFNKELSK